MKSIVCHIAASTLLLLLLAAAHLKVFSYLKWWLNVFMKWYCIPVESKQVIPSFERILNRFVKTLEKVMQSTLDDLCVFQSSWSRPLVPTFTKMSQWVQTRDMTVQMMCGVLDFSVISFSENYFVLLSGYLTQSRYIMCLGHTLSHVLLFWCNYMANKELVRYKAKLFGQLEDITVEWTF